MIRTIGTCLLAIPLAWSFLAIPSSGGSADATREAEDKARDVELLAEAYQMADNAEKYKLPELFVSAGHLLLRLERRTAGRLNTLDVNPEVTDEDGKVIKVDVKSVALERFPAQAKDLFDKAEDLAVQQKLLKPIKGLIEGITANPGEDLTRGAIGGPKMIVRMLPPKQMHTWALAFDTQSPGAIGFQASGPCHCKMVNQNGGVSFDQTVRVGQYNWQPRGKLGFKSFLVTVRNTNNLPVTYKLFTN